MRAVLILALLTSTAHADDGYCDFVEGVASAESALLYSPQVFGDLGRIEQASSSIQPAIEQGTVRFIGGLRWRISGIYEGVTLKSRAKAECKRHTALEQIRGETLYRAFEARSQVIDAALPEAEKLMAAVGADLDAKRTTAQEATATRLRVEELRRIATETQAAMSVLPKPSGRAVGLAAFQNADGDVEDHDAKLRRAKAFDVSLRVGIDEFLDDKGSNTSSPYFAVLSASVNLGVLFQGGGNTRAADGRRKYIRSGRDPLSVDATADRLKLLLETAQRRAQETAALEADLNKQIEVLNRVGGDDSRRYRQTVWFDLIKIRAERAYHEAHAAALAQVIGAT
ncbi:MAG: hypothetical protein ABI867_03730 [Kofleriaceae bacterium]